MGKEAKKDGELSEKTKEFMNIQAQVAVITSASRLCLQYLAIASVAAMVLYIYSIYTISSDLIGELVMNALGQIDHVAYIRYASVYRNFREASDFGKFVKEQIEDN